MKKVLVFVGLAFVLAATLAGAGLGHVVRDPRNRWQEGYVDGCYDA